MTPGWEAGLGLPGSDTEIVLATGQEYEPNWLVSPADEAAEVIVAAGGRVVAGPEDIAVGRLVAAEDPFGNVLVLLDLSKGHYVTDDTGRVTGVTSQQAPAGASSTSAACCRHSTVLPARPRCPLAPCRSPTVPRWGRP